VVQSFRKFSSVLVAATLVFALGACKSKKTAEDTTAPAETGDVTSSDSAPQIESTPMNFDAAGSDSGKIEGLQTINFEYDKASLSSDAKKKIQGNVAWMKANTGTRLQIEGHCDARGSIEYNLSLGERRANSVKSYMTSLGIAANRLSIISYGKEKPLSNGDSESDHVKNRRANFVPLGQ
jgi:peptidoglycan-associated lipoprotein